jgi:sugar diacid utilization regulator
MRAYVESRLRGKPSGVPETVALEVPVASGSETVGAVLLMGKAGSAAPEAGEFLHLAAVAVLTELAVADAKDEVEENLRGALLEQLRSGVVAERGDVVRRAARFGCDLAHGAVALCAEPTGERLRHLTALVADEVPGALAQLSDDGRVYALVPASSKGDAATTLEAANRVAARLRRHGLVGVSSFFADPASLGRALEEATLVLDVVKLGGVPGGGDVGDGTYRLLFRVLASNPEEVRAFYDDTIAPLARYDDQYGTDLVATLEAWFSYDCSTSATAAGIYVHRHTVAYRLDRVKELSGLDPLKSEDRERLGLGLKAGRVMGRGGA